MKLIFEKSIYSKEALLKAAFSCIDAFYIHISQDNECWLVTCEAKEDKTPSNPLTFENELIRQEVQIKLLNDNADVRKILLARAMASTVIDRDRA